MTLAPASRVRATPLASRPRRRFDGLRHPSRSPRSTVLRPSRPDNALVLCPELPTNEDPLVTQRVVSCSGSGGDDRIRTGE